MLVRRMLFAAVIPAAVLAFAPAGAAPVRALPQPAVIRIPDSAARPALTIDANAPVSRAEFATPIRTPGDRAVLRERIERARAAEAQRFARGAGAGIAVQLRRARY
jgi:hypothetical protein